MLQERIQRHERFWRGEGPCLILIPTPAEIAPTDGLSPALSTFSMDPAVLWNHEFSRARAVHNWPTDGIPTVRPNFGVVFVPAIAGQPYLLQEGQMPWPGEPLDKDAIRASRSVSLSDAELMRRAETFYALYHNEGKGQVAAYHPDTQGVFDIAHMLWGQQIFYDAIDLSCREWVDELLDICMDLYIRVSQHVKKLLGEPGISMIHGHGTAQGIHFPHAGVRTSEDTAILFSPATIEEIILPVIERSVAPFGGAFAHFCGRCECLFERLCHSPWIRAIDLQPGMHDLTWLLERCAETGTVLYSRVEGLPGESWEGYVRRIGGQVQTTGARCILRATVYPSDRSECAAMANLWHNLTTP